MLRPVTIVLLIASHAFASGREPTPQTVPEASEPAAGSQFSTVASAPEVLLRVRRTGGFAGVDERWWLHVDGHLVGSDGSSILVEVSRAAALIDTLVGIAKSESASSCLFPLPSPCMDCFVYTISFRHGDRRIRWESSDVPTSRESAYVLRELRSLLFGAP
jgi:hypothetical protein